MELDITYNGSIDYTDLRQIIFDYYKEIKGIKLASTSITYLKDKLTGKWNSQPFFITEDEFGETRFDIHQEEIQEILRTYLANKNYELKELNYDSSVQFKYKENKKKEQEKDIESTKTDSSSISNDEIEHLDEPQEEILSEEEPKETTPIPVTNEAAEELAKMAREQRKFTIIQRERAMSEEQKAKNRSAIIAGLCVLGAITTVYFNDQNISQVIQHELDAIYSWEALGLYIQDLGPLTTLLSAGAAGFIAKYLKHSKKLKTAQHEFEDFNASLEKTNTEELGGNENAKSR